MEMARPGGQTSHSLLETLADWGAYVNKIHLLARQRLLRTKLKRALAFCGRA
jgi:hypothetical protein